MAIDSLTLYVAEFHSPGQTQNELPFIDSIYFTSLKVSNHNHIEALLCATFTLIPYKEVPLHLPLINATIYYPLPSADSAAFEKKTRKTPRRFLFDSPNDNFGDSDKLAHFFGNAALAYTMRSNRLVLFFGRFVELFEKNFNVDSEVSIRDQLINILGVNFGYALLSNPNLKPSTYFTGYNIYYLFFYL